MAQVLYGDHIPDEFIICVACDWCIDHLGLTPILYIQDHDYSLMMCSVCFEDTPFLSAVKEDLHEINRRKAYVYKL